MKRVVRGIATLAVLMGTSPLAAAPDKPAYVYGPEPDWARFKALGEAAVRAQLPDAANWEIEWPNGYVAGFWRHKVRVEGYMTCGVLRSLAPPRGIDPITSFVVVIDQDQVKMLEIPQGGDRRRLINGGCAYQVEHGRLPPASLMAAPRDLAVASLGLTIRAMPEGAYVAAVTPGSPAARAGLAPGTVITSANGITLAGLGGAMARVLEAGTGPLALDTAAGAHIELQR